ncbi:hypothetical protein [Aliihoeflea sp. 2WW]|uniref:hypothetical protein n=1 Tax=Aliihoeflea sp. 2WW TaxID=1381123 RepID=UPI0012692182|nr:hypothetical protein [Aliihoeflea sp. 2WW]
MGSSFISAAVISLVLSSAAHANVENLPEHVFGRWSVDCNDPGAPALTVTREGMTTSHAGQEFQFDFEVSLTYGGGARADGSKVWMLALMPSGDRFAFIAEAASEIRAPLSIQEGYESSVEGADFLVDTNPQFCG